MLLKIQKLIKIHTLIYFKKIFLLIAAYLLDILFFLGGNSMAETAIFGAALGTGTALLIAVTIIMYKYYRLKQQTKAWHSLDQMPFPPVMDKTTRQFYPYPRTVSNFYKSFK